MSLLRMKSLEMNNSLQTRITEKLREEHETLQQYPLTDVCYMLFKNFQYSETTCSGLRLTKLGFTLLKEQYDMYRFPIPKTGLHNKLLLRLHEHMKWPYYLDRKNLLLFSEEDAMWLKLVGNDVEKFAKGLD